MNFKKIKLKDKIEVHDPFLQINKNDFQNLNIKKELNKNKVVLFENIFKFESKIETPTQFELLKEKDWHVPVSKMITICKNLNLSIVSYELPTPNVSLRYTLGIGFSFAICKGITVQW